jgi:N-acetylmuramoyl-L-alanine amidase
MWMNMAGCISVRRWSSVKPIFAAAALWGLATLPTPAANQITDVRFWSVGDVTRVAIEISGAFRYQSERLSGPERVFFDIPDTVPASKGLSTVSVSDGRVRSIRMAQTQPGVTRVVLDLEEGVEFAASQLTNPERLMVEVRGKGTKAAVAAPPPPAPEPVKIAAPVPRPVAAPARPVPATAKAPEVQVAAAPQKPDATPRPASRNSNGDRSLTRVLGLKVATVVLDPGHGGHDQGTKGRSGLLEKDLSLDVVKRLAALLENRLGLRVVLTRSDDTYVSLEERTEIANQSRADLFLSIHANWNPARSIAGIDTYYRYFSASREDLDLATRENAGTTRSVFDLEEAVEKIAARAKVDESRELAVQLQKTLHAAAAKENPDARSRPVKRAPFVVLIGADMPSALAEIGFLSNPKEEQLLNSEEHRQRLAEALYEGVEAYLTSLSHMELARVE